MVTKGLLVLFILLVLIIGGCANNDEITEVNDEPGEEVVEEKPVEEVDEDEFVPSMPVPDGLPVYPDAKLTGEISAPEGHWQWLYSTTGSGNDIVGFFVDALQDLGYTIDSDLTFAYREEFFISTAEEIVQVYWLDCESLTAVDVVTADTPNRSYSIVVHLDGWAAR